MRQWIKKNPERYAETQRRWREGNPERVREVVAASKRRHAEATKQRKKRWASENPEKRDAALQVRYAIARGDLVRQPCEDCGDPKSSAHHDDYTRPLDVRWLCGKHHRLHHAQGAIAP